TPDSERTMNTYLGANREFTKGDINFDIVADSRFLYFTGYMWDTDLQKQAVMSAIEIGKRNGAVVAFDVADPFAVNRNRDAFIELIEKNVDIVFANREEAKLLFGTETANDAAEKLSTVCDIAVVKDGAAGSLVKRSHGAVERIPVRNVKAVDTTGAGDMYAAGFLYGIISGLSDREAGICASYLASRVVETWGAQFPPDKREEVAQEVITGSWRFTD
ncbi:MAG: adenosine kinase, partial [Spirochaetales bacterium]|nr:adenosine kinase [Spirochaetales bacterium]